MGHWLQEIVLSFSKHFQRQIIIEKNNNFHKYSPVDGFVELKKAICTKFKRDNNLEYEIDQIVVSTGAKQSIVNAIMSLVNPGDEVIIPTPYWVSYSAMVTLAEGVSVFVNPKDSSHKITADQLESAITNKTKMLMLNSPNNPSGSVFTNDEYLEFSLQFPSYKELLFLKINCTMYRSTCKDVFVQERTTTIHGM